MHDTTNTCSCDCGVRATVQSIASVSGCVVPSDEVVKQRVVPWTWSLFYVPNEMTGVSPTSTSESKVCKARPGSVPHAQRQGTRGPVRPEAPDLGRGVVGAACE